MGFFFNGAFHNYWVFEAMNMRRKTYLNFARPGIRHPPGQASDLSSRSSPFIYQCELFDEAIPSCFLGSDHGLVRFPGGVPALERAKEAETLGRVERPQRGRP